MSKAISSIGFLCLGIGLCAIALAIYSQSSAFQVQDDAYMYSRYAQSLLRGDGMAWNPGGEPTYGATSLFYVPWVAAVSACLPGDPGRAIVDERQECRFQSVRPLEQDHLEGVSNRTGRAGRARSSSATR